MLEDLLNGAGRSVVFGLIGIGLMALGFVMVDLLTPGKLGDVICSPERHPGATVSAAAHFGTALIVAACIS